MAQRFATSKDLSIGKLPLSALHLDIVKGVVGCAY